MNTAGFVLVGGKSLRMGRDKARLELNGELLVDRVAALVKRVAGSVALVGNPTAYADLPFECLADLHPGCGPLAGIEAALASGRGEFNLIVACDLPGLRVEWLRLLLDASKKSGARCVVARGKDGKVQPLCGVYRASCLTVVSEAIAAGRLRAQECVEELEAAAVELDSALANVNTPGEWAAFQTPHAS